MAIRDSDLEQSIGPLTPGHDLLPVDMNSSGNLTLTPALPVLSLRSDQPLPEWDEKSPATPAFQPAPPADTNRAPGEIWLDGDVIMCACPDCQAPMSVRLWLMMAQCWRCDTGIELNEDQERQVQQLLAERQRQQRQAAAVPPPPPPPTAAATQPTAERRPAKQPTRPAAPAAEQAATPAAPIANPPPAAAPHSKRPAERTAPPAPPAPPPPPAAPPPRRLPAGRSAAANQPSAARQRRPASARRRVTQPLTADRILKMTPAWLISMLLHLLLITLLAIFRLPAETHEGPLITLNATVSTKVKDEGETNPVVITELAKFDMPVPDKKDLADEKARDVLLKANQDALELRVDPSQSGALPPIDILKDKLTSTGSTSSNVLARDPRLRAELVTNEGGTTLTEAAVARGLRWLAMHQSEDGSWSLNAFHRVADCNCRGQGAVHHKAPGTALAMLPFLGAGQTHFVGRYQQNVSRGLRWLLEHQAKNGDLRAGADDNTGMYTHGQATIVLCEAFAMTGDEQLRIPAQKAVDFICDAQYTDGGWRYKPSPRNQPGDTSVVGWQLMALQSARAANLTVPDETLVLADRYFDSVQTKNGSRYSYMVHSGPTEVMTAEALLCRMYLGWTRNENGLINGARFLVNEHLPNQHDPNIYYWYYGTQTMHHLGGGDWDRWNTAMRDILTTSQETQGHAAGSWSPRGAHSGEGGRIYMTSLAICTLEVYYRHLPLFRQIELER